MRSRKVGSKLMAGIRNVFSLLASVRLTVLILAFLIPVTILGTLIPQGLSSQEYIHKFGWPGFNFVYRLGLNGLFKSYWFLALLLSLGVNVILCTLQRILEKKSHFGFILTHLSLIVLIFGGVLSAHGRVFGEIRLAEGQATSSFKLGDADVPLGFEIRLKKFEIEWYDSREKITARLPDAGKTFEFTVRRNFWTQIPDSSYRFRVEQYVPDFRMDTAKGRFYSASDSPNNPAIYVHVTSDSKEYGEWVFDRFPDFHMKKEEGVQFRYRWAAQSPKAFRSYVEVLMNGQKVHDRVIEVNRPLRFGGFLIYQADYDVSGEKWTGLGVVQDPGSGLAYLGMIGLMVGLVYNIYLRSWIGKKRKA